MHKRFKAVSCVAACAVVLMGSSLAVNAAPASPMLVTAEPYQLSNNVVAEVIEQKVAASQLITEEIALQLEAALTVEAMVGTDLAHTAVAQVEDYVNVREAADENSKSVGKLYNEAVAAVIAEEGEWLKIQSGSVEGYVKAEYVVVGDEALVQSVVKTVATVQADALNVRAEASTDAAVVTRAIEEAELEVVVEDTNGWIQVSTGVGEGYIASEYVEVSKKVMTALTPAEEREQLMKMSAGRGQAVVDYASQFVGNPYVYGGTSLTNGADCSGFVMSVYAHFGVSLPHSSSAMRGCGYEVSLSEIQPGDIVCYSGHVGIYAGNNTLVHASNEKDGIKYTSPVNYRSIVTIRRIF